MRFMANQINCAVDGEKLAWMTVRHWRSSAGRDFLTLNVWNKNDEDQPEEPTQACLFLEKEQRNQLRRLLGRIR